MMMTNLMVFRPESYLVTHGKRQSHTLGVDNNNNNNDKNNNDNVNAYASSKFSSASLLYPHSLFQSSVLKYFRYSLSPFTGVLRCPLSSSTQYNLSLRDIYCHSLYISIPT